MICYKASIGANSTILPGVEIGQFSTVGAGSVVTKTVNPFTVVLGNPAKFYRYITRENILLKEELIDLSTGARYLLNNEGAPIKIVL